MKKFIKTYLKNRPPFYSFIRPKELELLSRYMPYKNPILDFGCGDGFFAKTLLENEKIDVGTDINEKIKNEAKKSGVYKKVLFYDGKKLPLTNNRFSSVLSNCVLEHVDDLEPTLKDINRVMKKGGKFYTTVMCYDQQMGGLFNRR